MPARYLMCLYGDRRFRRGRAPSTIWHVPTSNTRLNFSATNYSTKFGRKWRELIMECKLAALQRHVGDQAASQHVNSSTQLNANARKG